MSDVKLCKDCRHCRQYGDYLYPYCLKAGPPDLVRGGNAQVGCYEARADESCGPDAKLWEAIPRIAIQVKAAHNVPPRWWQFWKKRVSLCPGSIQCGNKCPAHNGGPE